MISAADVTLTAEAEHWNHRGNMDSISERYLKKVLPKSIIFLGHQGHDLCHWNKI